MLALVRLVNSKSYGRFFVKGKHVGAHRYSWTLTGRGEIPKKTLVCQMCDNKLCVNPDHLVAREISANNHRTALKRDLQGKGKASEKPYVGFPLFPLRGTGRWCKKIRGKHYYFGSIADDPHGEAALELFEHEWPYRKKGITPPPLNPGDELTIEYLCDEFLNSKLLKLDSGGLSESSFRDYYRVCGVLVDYFGKNRVVDDLRPDDFQDFRHSLVQRLGVVTLRNEINRIRIVLKFASDQRLIDRPVYFGQSFDRPSLKELRRARNQAGPRMFEAEELRRILDSLDGKIEVDGKPLKADPILKAMVLLGVNGGLGNTDVANLPQSAIDFESGWLDYPRPKTEIHRRIPLWPETISALREAIKLRPDPIKRDDPDLCFITVQGNKWVRVERKMNDGEGEDEEPIRIVKRDNVASRFSTLLQKLNINGRKRLGFYTLRHVFETEAGESRDQVAVDAVMGHSDLSISASYRERISDERLRAVTAVVRAWLFPDG